MKKSPVVCYLKLLRPAVIKIDPESAFENTASQMEHFDGEKYS